MGEKQISFRRLFRAVATELKKALGVERLSPQVASTPFLDLVKAHERTKVAARIQIVVQLVVLATLMAQLFFGWSNAPVAAIEVGFILVASLAATSRCSNTGFWGPAPLFLLVVGIFHLGLVPYWVFKIDPGLPRGADYIWFSDPVATRLMLICAIAVVSFSLGAAVIASVKTIERDFEWLAPKGKVSSDEIRRERMANAGAAMLLLGLAWWLTIALTAGGPGVLFGPYQEFLRLTKGTLLPQAYFIIGPALGLALVAPARGGRRWVLAIAAALGAVAFFLGLRGEVLFPLTVALSVIAFRRVLPRLWLVLTAGIVALTLISAAKIIRQAGIGEIAANWLNASPLKGLAELGQSIRVLAVVTEWHDKNGEPFLYGSTYTSFFARSFELLFGPNGRPPARDDYRLMNVEIQDRAGAIGGSAIAEAYHNFALPGVIIVFLLLGVLFGYFSTMRPTTLRIAVFVSIAVPMLNHVRNSFTPVVPAVFASLTFACMVIFIPEVFDYFRRRTSHWRRTRVSETSETPHG